MNIKEYIDSVTWGDLKTAHGNAAEVPDALIALNSEDPKTADKAHWKLDNVVVLQSDLYESAFYVIPVLVEYATREHMHNKEIAYDILYEPESS
jgi:hypothetical protein